MSERKTTAGRQALRTAAPADLRWTLLAVAGLGLFACEPKVEVQAPKEPITINLNIKLDADVRLRIEEKAKQDVDSKPIF